MGDHPRTVVPKATSSAISRDRRQQEFDGLRRHPAKEFITTVAVNEVKGDDVHRLQPSSGPQKGTGPKRQLSASKRHARQNSLRHANSVELMHKRWRSGSGTHVVSDGSSGFRGGRQFTVGNVGSNGTIFLRPVVRPPPQRNSPPHFVFPLAAPETQGKGGSKEVVQDDSMSGTRTPRTPRTPTRPPRRSSHHEAFQSRSHPRPRIQHDRTLSCSTIDDRVRAQKAEAGGFRVVIDRPQLPRPRTADEPSVPTLEVPIPHYRLGTPRFSARGTAFLHNSIYTRTSTNDDIRSSVFSQGNFDTLFPIPPGMERPPLSNRWNPLPSASTAHPMPSSSEAHGEYFIHPSIYDDLTFAPQSESPAVIRYSPMNGSIIAATPARLIAQITSPTFLDYELLSDFFLTYRSFLSAYDLVSYLMARLQWASERPDEVGKIVRVRTFVAIRHWILNYFVDDFVPDFALRAAFCDSLNLLCGFLKQRFDFRANAFKIIGQLKKCWRRTHDLYWDPRNPGDESNAEEDIYPGGPAGTREDTSASPRSPSRLAIDAQPPSQTDSAPEQESKIPRPPPASATRHTKPGQLEHSTPARPRIEAPPLSPTSEMSVPVLSCSFPAKTLKRTYPTTNQSLASTPIHVIAAPISDDTQPHAAPPSPLVKRARPNQAHKRSGSFSDALRDHRAILPFPSPISRGTQILMAFPFAESLIRGNLYPPPQPYVTEMPPLTPPEKLRSADYFSRAESNSNASEPGKGPATASPGMKKLLGSVRRAWSTKTPGDSPTSTVAGETCSSNPSPNAKLPQGMRPSTANARQPQRGAAARAPLRIDLLAANISETFEMVAKEQARAMERGGPINATTFSSEDDQYLKDHGEKYSNGTSLEGRNDIQSMATHGSRSIVIIDDTGEPMPFAMSGALPYSLGGSAIADDTRLPLSRRPSTELQESVPIVLDRDGNSESDSTRPSLPGTVDFALPTPEHISQQSNIAKPPEAPPLNHSTSQSSAHSRGKSFKSNKSGSLRRFASVKSGMSRRANQSFDAATVTEPGLDSSTGPFARPPERLLRRRPGGDLRAARKVNDLEPLPRPRSASSLTTLTCSISSSVFQRTDAAAANTATEPLPTPRRRYSLGALAENSSARATSFINTHSSQPNLRPSFELEVAKLAQLPDDEEDGGIESTLLKLEGRFDKTGSGETSPQFSPEATADRSCSGPVMSTQSPHPSGYESEELRAPPALRTERLFSAATLGGESSPESAEPIIAGLRPRDQSRSLRVPPSPSIESEDSYSSIPLLERGLSDRPRQTSNLSHTEPESVVSMALSVKPPQVHIQDPELSFEYVEETDSMRKIPKGATMPMSHIGHESFLLDDDEDLSDISSDVSTEVISRPGMSRESSTAFPGAFLPTHVSEKPAAGPTVRPPPSPPLTTEKALSVTPSPPSHPNQFQNHPPTPVRTPTNRDPLQRTISMPKMANTTSLQPKVPAHFSAGLSSNSVHLCFILEYDSELLAQQFTLIEKHALNEVDWKELVDLRSKDFSSPASDWVDFLKSGEPSGVELVIARFNIMVKWVLSEIVLTQNMEERARTITKYIHIAAHARRYRNFATMYQITIALMSSDCSRLTKTWQMILPADVRIFKDLETLVQPIRNFHKLRVEMETSLSEGGCIPFIGEISTAFLRLQLIPFANDGLGVYTHDLIFNSHRHGQADLTQAYGEPLVNFERHRTTAGVVKSLLRLLEASSRYTFKPVEEVLSKCLWMSKLPDDEIYSLSKQLE
ncbi:MAG: Guanine nucleotide exchange factor lte1 [Sclerophora amabilis]|nr:MAG: Guanine nucleotide exchange factor lte1 [Sclerophora amabilis]